MRTAFEAPGDMQERVQVRQPNGDLVPTGAVSLSSANDEQRAPTTGIAPLDQLVAQVMTSPPYRRARRGLTVRLRTYEMLS